MDAIVVPATITEDRRLIVQLPTEIPAGPVELVIRSLEKEVAADMNSERERLRAKALAAGILNTSYRAPEGTVPLSPAELLHLGTLPPGARSSLELIDEDRGPR